MKTTSIQWQAVINGTVREIEIPPSRRLLDILREDLDLTGTKISCEIGRCGACMVLIDGEPMNSCLMMAYQCEGTEITTIEGLHGETEDALHPIQEAFLEEGGFQCGYCTPGMIISTKALLDRLPQPEEQEIKEGLCGNLCRCTGYGGIMRAVESAADKCAQRSSLIPAVDS
ncbi:MULTISPECIES: (2Fe-2S)-binding protein [Paenibacillus]|uniref:(2Fe-2S)-binding protein n=1 Tax=Paenibacillus TaxID=44249 RepID=UPI00037BEE3D|nr:MULTISPECIES: (2Fe-2S)-binding protein [Paenibacillus]